MAELPITRIWINNGCIACGTCQDLVPQVFKVTADNCRITDAAQQHFVTCRTQIIKAAEECPTKVIRVLNYNERPAVF